MVDFAILANHRLKLKENEKKDKYLDLARELKKLWNMKVTFILINDWCSWYTHQSIIKGTGGPKNKRTSGDHQNNYIIVIGQITEKSPEYLRVLAVSQTSVKDHQLTLMRKTHKD